MRRPDTAKQRVRLGTNQYRSSRRNTATNSNRFAESCVKRYSLRGGNAYANSNSHSNSNANGHSYAECNSDTDGNGYSYHDSISDTYGDTKSHAET